MDKMFCDYEEKNVKKSPSFFSCSLNEEAQAKSLRCSSEAVVNLVHFYMRCMHCSMHAQKGLVIYSF